MVSTKKVLEVFAETMNLGIARAAETMNTMFDTHVALAAPDVRLLTAAELETEAMAVDDGPYSSIEMRYSGTFDGFVELVFETESAGRLVDCLCGVDHAPGTDFDSIRSGTLCEIGNIVINAVLGTMANMLDAQLSFSVPFYHEGFERDMFASEAERETAMVLLTKATFSIQKLEVTGDIILFFSFSSFQALCARIPDQSPP